MSAPAVLSVIWHSDNTFPGIHCSAPVLEDLAELAMRGFRRYPWGGAEIGGVLFGLHVRDGIHIHAFRPCECEHEHGPAFELSTTDFENLSRLLAEAASDDALQGLVPIGWYHSVSKAEISLSDRDRALHARFFPEPWQFAMTLKRSRRDPLSVGFFCAGAGGALSAHSPQQEFLIEDFRLHVTAPEPTAPLPVSAASESAAPEIPANVEPTVELPVSAVSEAVALELPKDASFELIARPEVLELPPDPPDNPYRFLGLTQDPFASAPDPRFFCETAQHNEALAILLHGIQSRKGVLALLGESGVGKSLVLACLMERLKAQAVEFAFLFSPKVSPDQLELLAHDLDLKCAQSTKAQILIALTEHLFMQCQLGRTTVLIVDNAQKLRTDVLEEIEMLGNLENRRGPLLQVIFAAQPSFEVQLEKAELSGLRQRLYLRAMLRPLSAQDTTAYVEERLKMAGLVSQDIFSADLLSEIHVRTRGVPRLVNAMCSSLLQMCFEHRTRVADPGMLEGSSAALNGDERRTAGKVPPEKLGAPV